MDKPQDLRQKVEELVRDISSRRYRGEDPEVVIDPQDNALTVVAKVMAAERSAARLRYNGVSVNPVEDLAEDALQRAMHYLQFWNFYAARLFLDEAAIRTIEPGTHQRIALFRLLVDFVAAVVRREPGLRRRELAKQARSTKQAIESLDLLPPDEREHYLQEVDRLRKLWGKAAKEPYPRALWFLVRARRSMDEEEPLLGLAWLIGAYRILTDPEGPLMRPSRHLEDLVEKARGYLAAAMGEVEAGDETEEVHTAELFSALVALASAQLDRSLEREMALFTVRFYQSAEEG